MMPSFKNSAKNGRIQGKNLPNLQSNLNSKENPLNANINKFKITLMGLRNKIPNFFQKFSRFELKIQI